MKKETIDKYVAGHLPAFTEEYSPKEKERSLRLLIKEVERDTRHAACDEVNKLHNRIHNLEH